MNDASGTVLSSPIFKLTCSSSCLFISYFDNVDRYTDQRVPLILGFAPVRHRCQILRRILLHPVSLYLWLDLQSSWLSYACYSWYLRSCGYIAVMVKTWKCILGDREYRKHPHLLSSKKSILGKGHLFRFPYSCPLKHFERLVNRWGSFSYLNRLAEQVGYINRHMQGVGAVLGCPIVIQVARFILLYHPSLHLQTLLLMKEISWWQIRLSIIFQASHYYLLDLWALPQEYSSVPLIEHGLRLWIQLLLFLGRIPSLRVTSRERRRFGYFLPVLYLKFPSIYNFLTRAAYCNLRPRF